VILYTGLSALQKKYYKAILNWRLGYARQTDCTHAFIPPGSVPQSLSYRF